MYIYAEVFEMPVKVRKVTTEDVPAITEIFNQGIEAGVATLETRIQKESDIMSWTENRYMVLVAEDDATGDVCDYVSLNKFNFKSAYTGVADLST